MTHAVLDRDTLMPRPPGGMGPGLVLAMLVHAALVVAIAFSVRWRASEPEGIEAELWAAVPQIAAPRAVEPEPPPQPEPKPEPAPPPPAPKEAEPQPDPQIAIEKAKREEAERRRREEAEKLAEKQRKEEAERVAEKRKQDEADKRKKQEEQQRLAAAEQARKKNLERLMAEAGATGDPSSTGTAQRTAGPSSGYAGRIKARIKPNIVFTDLPEGNPLAEV